MPTPWFFRHIKGAWGRIAICLVVVLLASFPAFIPGNHLPLIVSFLMGVILLFVSGLMFYILSEILMGEHFAETGDFSRIGGMVGLVRDYIKEGVEYDRKQAALKSPGTPGVGQLSTPPAQGGELSMEQVKKLTDEGAALGNRLAGRMASMKRSPDKMR